MGLLEDRQKRISLFQAGILPLETRFRNARKVAVSSFRSISDRTLESSKVCQEAPGLGPIRRKAISLIPV